MPPDEPYEARGSGAVLSTKELAAERRLIEACQQEPGRFAQLYERYFNRVYAFALVRTANRTAAEDVTAETFRLAFQNLSRFEWRGVPFSAWLFRIAANAATDLGQQTARHTTLDELPNGPSESWEAAFIEVELRVQLFALVRRLPGDQQKIIVMRFAQEMSIKEIAAAVGRSEGAVKQLQFRAFEKLRGWLGESHE